MFKKFLALISILMLSGISFAGELEDAAQQDKPIFLYMYTQNCRYCRYFNLRYQKLSNMYDRKYYFLKIDANTEYGNDLMRRLGARYVPYVTLVNPKTSQTRNLPTDCLETLECIEKAMKNFY